MAAARPCQIVSWHEYPNLVIKIMNLELYGAICMGLLLSYSIMRETRIGPMISCKYHTNLQLLGYPHIVGGMDIFMCVTSWMLAE
jgi:hypothetical protein